MLNVFHRSFIGKEQETYLTYLGFLQLLDPPFRMRKIVQLQMTISEVAVTWNYVPFSPRGGTNKNKK